MNNRDEIRRKKTEILIKALDLEVSIRIRVRGMVSVGLGYMLLSHSLSLFHYLSLTLSLSLSLSLSLRFFKKPIHNDLVELVLKRVKCMLGYPESRPDMISPNSVLYR